MEDADFAFDMICLADRFSVLDLKRLCERTLIMAPRCERFVSFRSPMFETGKAGVQGRGMFPVAFDEAKHPALATVGVSNRLRWEHSGPQP